MKNASLLFFLLIMVLQTNAQRGLGIHGGYSMPTSNIKLDAEPFLFLKDAKSVGIDYSFGFKNSASGFKFSADYIMATTNTDAVASYAKQSDIPYKTFNFTQSNPTGISVMAGPNIMLFAKSSSKRLPLIWLDLQAGAIFSNPQSLQFLDAKNNPTKEIKTSNISFVYSPMLTVNLLKTKGLIFNAKVGYNSVGGFSIGIGIAPKDCSGVSCYRCCGTYCVGKGC
jgi:hypothetical protein